MEIIRLHGGDTLVTAGSKMNRIYFVVEGTLKVKCPFINGVISAGFLLGIPREDCVFYPYDYIANENITVRAYEYTLKNDLIQVLSDIGRKNLGIVVAAYLKKIEMAINAYDELEKSADGLIDIYDREYGRYCVQCKTLGFEARSIEKYNEICDFFEHTKIPLWLTGYLRETAGKEIGDWNKFLNDIQIAVGFMLKTADDMFMVLASCSKIAGVRETIYKLFLDPKGNDILADYMNMLKKTCEASDESQKRGIVEAVNLYMDVVRKESHADVAAVNARFREYNDIMYSDSMKGSAAGSEDVSGTHEDEILARLKDSRFTILDLLGVQGDKQNIILDLLDCYARASDKNSVQDDMLSLRREITKYFIEIYESGFLKWVKEPEVPVLLKMFFNFGFLDERILDGKNQVAAYDMAVNWIGDRQGMFFNSFEWLKAVYEGRKDTSFDSMSLDYAGMLQKMRAEDKLTEGDVARELMDCEKRTIFEIRNMFREAMRLVSGRVSTYVPILSEHTIGRPLEAMLTDCNEVRRIIDKARGIDFRCFYRDKLYSNPDFGINMEYVGVEVLPEIIFMPCVGNRGVMWQEITGKKRVSPARFVLPLFASDNLAKLVLRMIGEFRWEMCKRIQGGRWNDISEPSLTGDYFGYLDSYKRNKELTPEVRDKIKNAYFKCKNNIREMFVKDYIDYLCYEANGTLKLNKVVRNIMLTYCPFNAEIRSNLAGNAMYREILERYEANTERAVHLLDMTIRKVESKGKEAPIELLEQRKLLKM